MATIELYGRTFDIQKRYKEWEMSYRRVLVCKAPSKAEVIKNFKSLDKEKVITSCDALDRTLERNEFFIAHQGEFLQTFGFSPPRDVLSFLLIRRLDLDVIALEKELQVPDGTSTHDFILNKYGERALDLVQKMM
jgi:hypothetical protein